MRKLYSTTVKDDFAFLLDILEIQGIKEEHAVSLNEHSENLYSIFVNDDDFDAACEILKEQDFERNELIADEKVSDKMEQSDFSDYENDELIWLLADTEKSQERRDKAIVELRSRGLSENDITTAVINEIKEDNKLLELTIEDVFWGFVNALFLGIPAIKKGVEYYSEKRINSVTNTKVFAYSEQSRKIALAIVISGIIIGIVELIYIARIFFF